MKINIQELRPILEKQSFIVKENMLAGEVIYLIIPEHMGATWNKDNLIFRSSVWNKDGIPVSLSFRKFFNLTEKPDLIPDPTDTKKATIREKVDGSALIISKYKGELVIRTRGTIDARNMENGHEIDELIKKYPKAFSNELLNDGKHSIIFEWVSPTNVIVLNYGKEPDIYLTGVINHEDYRYEKQENLECLGAEWGVKTTQLYTFQNMIELIKTVEQFKGKEGVCVYYNAGQDIKKVKGVEYLTLHAFKSEINLKNVVEMFLQFNKPDFNGFLDRIEKDFDFECRKMSMPLVSKVCEAYRESLKIITGIKTFAEPLKSIPRKEAAMKVISSYGKTIRASCVFKVLDGKEIDDKQLKTLIFQKLGES